MWKKKINKKIKNKINENALPSQRSPPGGVARCPSVAEAGRRPGRGGAGPGGMEVAVQLRSAFLHRHRHRLSFLPPAPASPLPAPAADPQAEGGCRGEGDIVGRYCGEMLREDAEGTAEGNALLQ